MQITTILLPVLPLLLLLLLLNFVVAAAVSLSGKFSDDLAVFLCILFSTGFLWGKKYAGGYVNLHYTYISWLLSVMR